VCDTDNGQIWTAETRVHIFTVCNSNDKSPSERAETIIHKHSSKQLRTQHIYTCTHTYYKHSLVAIHTSHTSSTLCAGFRSNHKFRRKWKMTNLLPFELERLNKRSRYNSQIVFMNILRRENRQRSTTHYVVTIDWLSSVLRPLQHSIAYMGDAFYKSKDSTNSIKLLEKEKGAKENNTKKHKENRKYTHTQKVYK